MINLRSNPPNARLTSYQTNKLKRFQGGDIQTEWEDILPRKYWIKLGAKTFDICRIIQ